MRSTTVVALGDERGDDQPRRRAQVGRHHGRARELVDALHDRDAAVDVDLRAQAQQLVDVHEAVLEDRLGDRRRAVGDAVERHQLRLHVGRERRVLAGANADRARPRVGADAQPAVAGLDRRAGLAQLVDHRLEVLAARVAQHDVAAGRRDRAQERAGLDPVGDDAVRDAVQPLDALDADPARAVALDARAHRDQHLGEVVDLGLLRRVLEDRLALGERRRHQQVLGAGDGDHVGRDARALQAPGAGDDVAVLDDDLGAHRLQPLDVLVDRPRADRAAAGQRDARLAEAREQRAEDEDRRAHRLDELVRRLVRGHAVGAQRQRRGRRARPSRGRRRASSAGAPSSSRRAGSARSAAATRSAVSSAAHISGSAAFLAPEMTISPASRRPPRMRSWSMGVAARAPLRPGVGCWRTRRG